MESEKLEGSVKSTSYRNHENNYTVLRLSSGKKEHTVVGIFPKLAVGEEVVFTGEWVEHPRYGNQFKAESVEIRKPTSVSAIRAFLSSGLIRGVGPKTAKEIVEHFGRETLNVLSENPERLSEIEGLGRKRIKIITESYHEQIQMRQALIFLQSLGIAPEMGMKISKFYNFDVKKVIMDNPFQLCLDIEGFPFSEADRIAQDYAFVPDAPQRLRSALFYCLHIASVSAGHCYLPREILITEAERLTQVDRMLIENQLAEMIIRQELILEEGEIGNVAVLPAYRGRGIARRLMEKMLSDALQNEAKAFTLEVRAGNLPAIRLYESLGFVQEGIRKRFYRDPEEDALILWKR